MNLFSYNMTEAVLEAVQEIKEEGLKKKIKVYIELLELRGFNLPSQYMDKVEGYKGLFKLRPHFHNIEFRMLFYWKGKSAQIVHTFYERGNKKTNQREYETAEKIRIAREGRK